MDWKTHSREWLAIFAITFILLVLAQSRMPALSWEPVITPQAYLPVMLKLSTPTPTATITPTPTAIVTPPPSDWLSYVNWLRSLGGLPALTENTSWSSGGEDHAKYMVKNDYIGHDEDRANPWYTQAGHDAAGASDVMVSSYTGATDIDAIDLWMSGPFHALGIIDPALITTGFGSYREADGGWEMGACLDVIRGLESVPPSITFPVMWPGSGGTIPYTGFYGGEWPDPLTSCPGYAAPSGPPVFLQIGSGNQVPNVTGHSFKQGGTSLEHCVFDETNYTNPDSSAQGLGRSVLNMRDSIVLMPRNPLNAGITYTISIINSGTTYTWSFTVTGTHILAAPNSEVR